MREALLQVIEAPAGGGHSVFVEGVHGSGKAACLSARICALRKARVPAHAILVLVPQRGRRALFTRLLAVDAEGERQGGGLPVTADFLTYYGLASRAVRLFWPAVAGEGGFASPERPPVFLTYETAQYLMGQIIAPRLARGFFEGLSMRPQRVLSQLLDNLNKAATNGFPLESVGERLQRAWAGEAPRRVCYDHAQECATAFRDHCLAHGLVDFSLAVELFNRHLLVREDFWCHLSGRYHHLLVDQVEETVPVAQDLIRRFLGECESAALFFDPRGGYRVFMGIDSVGASDLRAACGSTVVLPEPPTPPPMALARALDRYLGGTDRVCEGDAGSGTVSAVSADTALSAATAVAGRITCRYRADMIGRVAAEVVRLVGEGIPAGQIAVVAPHADGVLRHLLGRYLDRAGIPFSASRRFTALREERAARLGLTLAALAHPHWQVRPHPWDVAEVLAFIGDLDPVRAALAARHVYDPKAGRLVDAAAVTDKQTQRIGRGALARIDAVRVWIEASPSSEGSPPLDHFLRRLFGEVISRPRLTPDEAAAYARLVTSAGWFREAAPAMGLDGREAGHRFLEMVWDGVVAAAPVETAAPVGGTAPSETADPQMDAEDAVLLVAPVYTYLLQPRRARFQFWLDVGSMRWWEPPHQPLTNPHVLARSWPEGARWTDAVDYDTRNRTLRRLVHGLCRRCAEAVYVCSSELEEAGEPQDSPLLRALDRIRPGRVRR